MNIIENVNLIKKFKTIKKKNKIPCKKLPLRNLFKYINNIFALTLIFLGRYLYIKSLKGCYGDEYTCINFGLQYILDDIYYCLKSCFIFLIFLFLIQFKLCSCYLFIIFIFIMLELILKDHGQSLQNHGLLNFEALLLFLFFGEIIILIILLIVINIKKKRFFINGIILCILLSIYILIYINYKDQYYCKNWTKGLNNSYIINDDSIYPCSINIPKKCLIYLISNANIEKKERNIF